MERQISKLLLMSADERFHYLATHCVYLLSKQKGTYRQSLFACDNFYLEVCYDVTGDGISDMQVVINTGKIERYLEAIDL